MWLAWVLLRLGGPRERTVAEPSLNTSWTVELRHLTRWRTSLVSGPSTAEKRKWRLFFFFPLLGLFRLHPPTNQPGSGRRRETVSSFHSCTCHFCVLFRVDECGHAIGKRRRRFSRLPCRVPPGLKLQKWLCWYYRVPCIFQLGSVF